MIITKPTEQQSNRDLNLMGCLFFNVGATINTKTKIYLYICSSLAHAVSLGDISWLVDELGTRLEENERMIMKIKTKYLDS